MASRLSPALFALVVMCSLALAARGDEAVEYTEQGVHRARRSPPSVSVVRHTHTHTHTQTHAYIRFSVLTWLKYCRPLACFCVSVC